MIVAEITYDYAAKTLTVILEDGATTTYTEADKVQFLTDCPDRVKSTVAIGWA